MRYFSDNNTSEVFAYDDVTDVDLTGLTEITEDEARTRSQKSTPFINDMPSTAIQKALQHIDVLAEATRLKYITTGAGQAMIYQEKMEEALDFATAGYPEAEIGNYPFIEAEAEIQNVTGRIAADEILSRATIWRQKGVAIEKERRRAKLLIEQQTTIEGIENVLVQVTNTLNSI